MNFYNENDPKAADWLRSLIRDGHIPMGKVDTRSIVDVRPEDLDGFTQYHFFAGIGGWPLALRLANWPDDKPVCTGSCPCPPFSTANSRKAICPECGGKSPIPCPVRTGYFICLSCEHAWFADGRHLWPEFYRLIRDRRFPVVFGEQVAGKDGEIWFSGIRATLAAIGYGAWASDLCAASVSAPQKRQRLFWMANADRSECGRIADGQRGQRNGSPARRVESDSELERGGAVDRVGHTTLQRRLDKPDHEDAAERNYVASGVGGLAGPVAHGNGARPLPAALTGVYRSEEGGGARDGELVGCGDAGRLGDHHHSGPQGRGLRPDEESSLRAPWTTGVAGILCTDGKTRRVKPGIFPLANGVPARVVRIRGYGNAIVAQVACEFIEACEEASLM